MPKPNNCRAPDCNPADQAEGLCCGWSEGADNAPQDAASDPGARTYPGNHAEAGWDVPARASCDRAEHLSTV